MRKRRSLKGEDREGLLNSIQDELEQRAFGSYYCYTQFTLVHTRLTGKLVLNTFAAYAAALIQCYVLVTVLDTKSINFDNRNVDAVNYRDASKYYTENPYKAGPDTPANWYELTRKGHFGGVPCIVTGPLVFGSLMIALSLRRTAPRGRTCRFRATLYKLPRASQPALARGAPVPINASRFPCCPFLELSDEPAGRGNSGK